MTIYGHRASLSAQIGIVIVIFFALMATIGPWFAPYKPDQSISPPFSAGRLEIWAGNAAIYVGNHVGRGWSAFLGLFGGSASFTPTDYQDDKGALLFGADQIGRDMLTRLIYGARMTIGISAATTLLSAFIGISLGLTAATLSGWVDLILSRLVDVILSIPPLILALIVLGVLGSSIPVLVLTIAIIDAPKVFRLARALGMNITVLDFVEVARMRGEGLWWIIRAEILPNATAPLVSEFGLRFCFNFLFVAALSFLGFGVQPPYADWGGMVKDNAQVIVFGLLAPLYPAIAIATLTVGVNLVVDWLLSIDARPSGAQAEM